jgi:hypothetical protein
MGALEVVKELLRNGANKNLLNCDNHTAIDINKNYINSTNDFMTAMGLSMNGKDAASLEIKELLSQNNTK